jgi:hypothetical protein
MVNLEPLIVRLIEDVLRAIRGATLEELRDLMAASTASPRNSSAVAGVPVSSRRVKPRVPRRTVGDAQLRKVSNRADAAAGGTIRDVPAGADITDPERLLATTPLPRAQRGSVPGALTSPEQEPPSSTVRPVLGSVVSLRPGESLASASGAGVVIRRARKA